MGSCLYSSLCLFLIFWLFAEGCANSCTPVSYIQYTLAPPPMKYNGSMTLGPSCNPQDNIVACTTNGLLGNGLPMSLVLNVSTVHAWNESVDIVFTTATTTATTRVRQVNLYFHHDPSQRIGLPFVELYWSDTSPLIPLNYLRYTIVGNQDLSESDTRLRNVSLVVITPEVEQPLHRYLRVHFTFNTTVPVDWVLLSEVQLCSDSDFQLEPISFEEGITEVMVEAGNFTTTSITLSCTVANDGYFQWEWTFPSSSVQSQIQLSEASRTSTAQISNMGSPLSVAFEGEYTCRAGYRVGTELAAPTPAERTITLQLERELEQVEDTVTVSEDDPTATLGCELWGYVTSDEITWAISGQVLENDTMFTITTEEGSRLLKVGDNPPRPSIRSILTIHELISQPTPYVYFCFSPDFSMVPRVVTLIVEESTVTPSTTASTSTANIIAEQAVITLPDDQGFPNNFAVLNCQVEPNDISVESQWRLPSGELLAEGNHMSGRYLVQDGSATVDGMMVLLVQMFINRISYQDAGNYTCETRPDDTGDFVSATVELRTRVQIEAQSTSVDVFDNTAQVELSCEMTLFIRPDEDLQWFMGGQAITSGTGNYTITYRDGTPTAAVNGGQMRVPGRVSVLTIFNPEESDSGTYTCSIAGTSESDTVELSVVAFGASVPVTSSVVPTPSQLAPVTSSVVTSSVTTPTQPAVPVTSSEVTTPTPTRITTPEDDGRSIGESVFIRASVGGVAFGVLAAATIVMMTAM